MKARVLSGLVAALCLVICSCSGGGKDASDEFTMAGFLAPSPMLAGLSNGEFEGLGMKFVTVDSGVAALPLVKNGTYAGIDDLSAPAVSLALAKDVPVKIVWMLANAYVGLGVSKGINDAAGLKGKRVGVTLGTISEYGLDQYLRANGVEPKSVRKVDLPPDGMPAAFKHGEVDAVYTWEPYLSKVRSDGAKLLERTKSNPTYVMLSEPFIEDNRATAQRLVCSYASTQRLFQQEPDKAYELLAKRLSLEPSELERILPKETLAPVDQIGREWLGTGEDESRHVDMFHKVGQWMADNGKVQKAPSKGEVAGVFDRSLAAEATKDGCK